MNWDIKDFLDLLVVDEACYMFLIVMEDEFGEDYLLKLCGEAYSEV